MPPGGHWLISRLAAGDRFGIGPACRIAAFGALRLRQLVFDQVGKGLGHGAASGM
jgi:hypothetical protein